MSVLSLGERHAVMSMCVVLAAGRMITNMCQKMEFLSSAPKTDSIVPVYWPTLNSTSLTARITCLSQLIYQKNQIC